MRMIPVVVAIISMCACGGSSSDDAVDADPNAPDAFGSGPPIEAPDQTWTWVPFPESRCMNSTATGIGVNLNPASRRVLIFLEGGGACFNVATCATVAHVNGFGQTEFNQLVSGEGTAGVFNRGDTDNPFHDWNFVFVPYCSGDIHAGLNETGMGSRMFVGYRNIGLYLERLSPTFPDAELVMLTGVSAGGFGAAFNFDRVQQAFGNRPVVLLDDSGPPMSDTYLAPCLQQLVRDAWHLDDTLPADCTDCRMPGGGGLINLAIHSATKYPNRRKGLITSTRDGVIRQFFGFGYQNCTGFQTMPETVYAAGIAELTQILAPYDSSKAFVIESAVHTFLLDTPLGNVSSNGVKLTDWIRDMLDTGGTWTTVRP